jgi:hypothetical protein
MGTGKTKYALTGWKMFNGTSFSALGVGTLNVGRSSSD